MQHITLDIGSTSLKTTNAALARQVLEQEAGLACTVELIAGELGGRNSICPPAIGQLWAEQGGIYVGLMRGENGAPDYHLIVAADPAGSIEAISWGSSGQEEPGATSSLDGLANTRALLDSPHDHPAAQWAAGLQIDGHHDFYLPARRELRLCWVNVPELFEEAWYWSSTQYSPYGAWFQYFVGGDQDNVHKGTEGRARAVRRVLTTSPL